MSSEQGADEYVCIVAYYTMCCYNTAVLPMGGDREAPERNPAPQHAEQPRLEAADGG